MYVKIWYGKCYKYLLKKYVLKEVPIQCVPLEFCFKGKYTCRWLQAELSSSTNVSTLCFCWVRQQITPLRTTPIWRSSKRSLQVASVNILVGLCFPQGLAVHPEQFLGLKFCSSFPFSQCLPPCIKDIACSFRSFLWDNSSYPESIYLTDLKTTQTTWTWNYITFIPFLVVLTSPLRTGFGQSLQYCSVQIGKTSKPRAKMSSPDRLRN